MQTQITNPRVEKFKDFSLSEAPDALERAKAAPLAGQEFPRYRFLNGETLQISAIGCDFSEATKQPVVVKHNPTGVHYILLHGHEIKHVQDPNYLHYHVNNSPATTSTEGANQKKKWWNIVAKRTY